MVLDADLAKLYGVATKALNQALKRNPERFPSDFAFQLTPEEVDNLKSQNATALDPDRSQFVTGQDPRAIDRPQFAAGQERNPEAGAAQMHRRTPTALPWAFTEHGALMAANVLRSEKAVHMGIYIVRAFVALRRHALEHEGLGRRLAEAEGALLRHDAALDDIYWQLEPLLAPPPETKPPRRMGFNKD